MAKRDRNETAVTKVSPNFLSAYAETDTSLDAMTEYRIVPRLKIIQSMSEAELKDTFNEGSTIIRPGNMLVWAKNDPGFLFVPQFFFVEFSKIADRRDKDNPMIMERTFDPLHEVAKRARDMERRFEPYPGEENKQGGKKFRYVEHLRFVGVIYGDHELTGTTVTLSFERGDFSQGRNFISALQLRKIDVPDEKNGGTKRITAPLWSQVWQFSVSLRDRGEKKWYGFDFAAPTEADPFITEREHEAFYTAHLDLRENFAKDRLRVDGDEHDEAEATVPDDTEV